MAKIEFFTRKSDEKTPVSTETIEVRPWALGGQQNQEFSIGSGGNFDATCNVWLEISYWVNSVQFFYSRNFLHTANMSSPADMARELDDFTSGASDWYGFGDMLPETAVSLKRTKHTYQDQNQEEQVYIDYELKISLDIGAVVGETEPGIRMFNLKFSPIDVDDGVRFMRDLTQEIQEVYEGKHPSPAELAERSGEWSFARELNRKAYDVVSQEYIEDYFSNPHLTQAFDSWLGSIPAGGHVLDAGCGHGKPVLSRLLEKGFHVTGTDLSPKMLERARANFPDVMFLNQMTSEITFEAEFDGVCSLSSLLYLDPIDLSHSLYRLYRALKPGGLLFLYGYDLHPGYRGHPYGVELDHWMWSWTYSMDEATKALEEHGFFKVLQRQEVSTEAEKQQRIEAWRKYSQEQHEQMVKQFPTLELAAPDLSKPPSNLAYSYIVVARRSNTSLGGLT